MRTSSNTRTTLEAVLARLGEIEAAHAREVADLRAELAAVRGAPARPTTARADRRRAPLIPFGRARADGPAGMPTGGGRTSRRGMLGTAAKVAAATVAAGVLVEQVATRPAYADNLGAFSSSVINTPAVSATGTNGADGVDATSDYGYALSAITDNGYAIFARNNGSQPGLGAVNAASINGNGLDSATSSSGFCGVAGVNLSNAAGSVAVLGHADDGNGFGGLGAGIGVNGETGSGTGVLGTASVLGAPLMYHGVPDTGVVGLTNGASGYAVYGTNISNASGGVAILGHSDNGGNALGPGIGVQGETAGGTGVKGTATTGIGLYGTSAGGGAKQAIQGVGTSGAAGLRASSDTGNGIVASSTSGTGLNVQSSTGSAVIATSNGVGYGLYLTASSGWAIGCNGRLRMLGPSVGTATLAHGTTTKIVSSSACSGSSQVILTPTSNPQVSIWATVAPGAFTIHASATPASDVTFSYMLIN